MRKNLYHTFDKIFVLNLHGSFKKKEKSPDGTPDGNVFDIQQGVSISFFVKRTDDKKKQVKYFDLYGDRNSKYNTLNNDKLSTINWKNLEMNEPDFFFVPKDFKNIQAYRKGIQLDKLFQKYKSGVESGRDDLLIDFQQSYLNKKIKQVLDDVDTYKEKYKIKNTSSFRLKDSLETANFNQSNIKPLKYKPFDNRFIYYDTNIQRRASFEVCGNLLPPNNYGIIFKRGFDDSEAQPAFISDTLIDRRFWSRPGSNGADYVAPLYLYPNSNGQQTLNGQAERKPNLDAEIVQGIADGLGLKFVPESDYPKASSDQKDFKSERNASEIEDEVQGPTPLSKAEHPSAEGISNAGEDGVHLKGGPHLKTFAPIDLLDYIYAVLHSPTYREKYKEFLKIDFPRVPYPNNPETFWQLVELGGELRQIHLLEHPVVDDFITTYPVEGSNEITKRLIKIQRGFIPYTKDGAQSSGKVGPAPEADSTCTSADHRYPNEPLGKIQLNNEQYFGRVPEKAWNFYIGGYQPAEK